MLLWVGSWALYVRIRVFGVGWLVGWFSDFNLRSLLLVTHCTPKWIFVERGGRRKGLWDLNASYGCSILVAQNGFLCGARLEF